MKIVFGSVEGFNDKRDYSLATALKKMGNQQGEELRYGVWLYKKPNEEDKSSTKEGFYEYDIDITSSEDEIESARHVLIPLNFPTLEQQSTLSVSINLTNELVLLDGNKAKGKIEVEDGKIRFISREGQGFKGDLVVNSEGKVVLYQKTERRIKLYLGEGYTKYRIDRVFWSPTEEQGEHLCTSNAGVALLEYFERVTNGRHLDASRLFLHKAACNLMHVSGHSGVSVRAVVAALKLIGVPPEEYWQYDLSKVDEEPPAFCYAIASNYRASTYLRLDRSGMDSHALVAQVKIFIYSKLPVIFSFSAYDSIYQSVRSGSKGKIPFPTFGEVRLGGHAAIVVGYDDNKIIINSNPLGPKDLEKAKKKCNEQIYSEYEKGKFKRIRLVGDHSNLSWVEDPETSSDLDGSINPVSTDFFLLGITKKDDLFGDTKQVVIATKGAFLMRNSWGETWGDQGYGWLPYSYVIEGLATDFWTVLKFEWLNTKDFGLPVQADSITMCLGAGKC